jgi:hypothetical protein
MSVTSTAPSSVRSIRPISANSGKSNRVEPVFPEKDQAINYAQNRASFRSGEIRILDSTGDFERILPFTEAGEAVF